MEIIQTVKHNSGDVVENYIKVEHGNYTHRQIERVGGKVFMRIKTRKMQEIDST